MSKAKIAGSRDRIVVFNILSNPKPLRAGRARSQAPGRITDYPYIDKNAENALELGSDRWPERERSVSVQATPATCLNDHKI